MSVDRDKEFENYMQFLRECLYRCYGISLDEMGKKHKICSSVVSKVKYVYGLSLVEQFTIRYGGDKNSK